MALKVKSKGLCRYDNHILENATIMVLEEDHRPLLNLAISKGCALVGAHAVYVSDKVVYEREYYGRAFSRIADVIFVSSVSHMCIQKFANESSVPVICMKSRTHAALQALATIMTIIEEFGVMENLQLGYLGPAEPVLNSYLLLCPALKANIYFKCCCDIEPVSPLLLHASKTMCEKGQTVAYPCTSKEEVIKNASVIISGPTTKIEKIKYFSITEKEITEHAKKEWIYMHTLPRGKEVDQNLFNHMRSRTFDVFNNMPYIAAALMAYTMRGYIWTSNYHPIKGCYK